MARTDGVRATRDHIDKTFKAGKCQLCGTKTPVAQQFRIHSDLDNLKAKKLKGAKAGESHYCADCAETRVKARQGWIDNVYSGNGKAKPKAKAKAKPKAKAAKPKKTTAKAKRPAKKTPAKPKAATSASGKDPF